MDILNTNTIIKRIKRKQMKCLYDHAQQKNTESLSKYHLHWLDHRGKKYERLRNH